MRCGGVGVICKPEPRGLKTPEAFVINGPLFHASSRSHSGRLFVRKTQVPAISLEQLCYMTTFSLPIQFDIDEGPGIHHAHSRQNTTTPGP